MGHYTCCVKQCKNTAKNSNCKFFLFPNRKFEIERKEKWIEAVRKANSDNSWTPQKWHRICSDHFVGNCKPNIQQHPGYIPSIFSIAQKSTQKVNKVYKRSSNTSCCVVSCHNTYGKTNSDTKFYSFPSRPHLSERRLKWIKLVNRINPDGTPWQPTINSRICSDHFIGGKKSEDPRHPAYDPTIFPNEYKQNEPNICLNRCKKRRTSSEVIGNDVKKIANNLFDDSKHHSNLLTTIKNDNSNECDISMEVVDENKLENNLCDTKLHTQFLVTIKKETSNECDTSMEVVDKNKLENGDCKLHTQFLTIKKETSNECDTSMEVVDRNKLENSDCKLHTQFLTRIKKETSNECDISIGNKLEINICDNKLHTKCDGLMLVDDENKEKHNLCEIHTNCLTKNECDTSMEEIDDNKLENNLCETKLHTNLIIKNEILNKCDKSVQVTFEPIGDGFNFSCDFDRESNSVLTQATISSNVDPDTLQLSGFHGYRSIKSDKQLYAIAGVTHEIFQLLLDMIPAIKFKKVNLENRLLIFLIRVKMGFSVEGIATIFDVGPTCVSRIVHEILTTLAEKTKNFSHWPGKENMQGTMSLLLSKFLIYYKLHGTKISEASC